MPRVPGVLIMAGLVAIVLHLAVAMPLNAAFLVGAMVSATDPVAVTASMRTLRAPEQQATLVESESLLNDGTGIVLFTIALASGAAMSDGLVTFVLTVVISVVIGLVLGGLAAWLGGRFDDVNLELTLTIIAAYGVYLVADRLGMSRASSRPSSRASSRELRSPVRHVRPHAWRSIGLEFLAFVLTAFVFLLIGLAITLGG